MSAFVDFTSYIIKKSANYWPGSSWSLYFCKTMSWKFFVAQIGIETYPLFPEQGKEKREKIKQALVKCSISAWPVRNTPEILRLMCDSINVFN